MGTQLHRMLKLGTFEAFFRPFSQKNVMVEACPGDPSFKNNSLHGPPVKISGGLIISKNYKNMHGLVTILTIYLYFNKFKNILNS